MMKKFLDRLVYRLSQGEYMTLDCRDHQHDACTICDCVCHAQAIPDASLASPNEPNRVIDRAA